MGVQLKYRFEIPGDLTFWDEAHHQDVNVLAHVMSLPEMVPSCVFWGPRAYDEETSIWVVEVKIDPSDEVLLGSATIAYRRWRTP